MEIFTHALTDTLKFVISMISILNPLGALPVFLLLTRNFSIEEIRKISKNCTITIFITLALSLLLGAHILSFFGISVLTFRVAGGILIASMALNMLRGENSSVKINQDELDRQSQIKEIGIVPLAIPLLAGPGSISTSIIHAENCTTPGQWISTFLGLIFLCAVVWLILTNSRKIRERIGRVGLNIMTRIMGLILLAVAIESITSGLKNILPGLAG